MIHLSVEKVVIIIINELLGSYAGKNALEIAWRQLSGGLVHRTLLIKNERAASAMVSPWDDGELASPRRGEARRGESNRRALSIKVFFFSFFAPCEICFHNLGVARVAFNI